MKCQSKVCDHSGHTNSVCLTCVNAGVNPRDYKTASYTRTCQAMYGVDNAFQAASVKATMAATNLERYGDVNPSGKNSSLLPILRERMKATGPARAAIARRNNLERYGETHPLKTAEGRAQYKQTMLAKHGVSNSMLIPWVKSHHAEVMRDLTDRGVFKLAYKKVQQTCLDRFGVDNIRKDISFMKAARLKATGYEYPLQSPKAIEKFEATCITRYGQRHHMQNAEIFAKTMAKAHKLKFYEFTFRGYTFGLIGTYEIFTLRYLLTKYKPSDVTSGTKLAPIKLSYRDGVYFPDFYVKSAGVYAEVKSLYTLIGCKKHGYSLFKANRNKAQDLHTQGIPMVWIVPDPTATTVCQLPSNWFEWSRTELTKYIAAHRQAVTLLAPDKFQCRLLHEDHQPA